MINSVLKLQNTCIKRNSYSFITVGLVVSFVSPINLNKLFYNYYSLQIGIVLSDE